MQKQAKPANADPDGQGKREPKAKATKPTHQAAQGAAQEGRTPAERETHSQIPRIILLGEKRGESPTCKRKEGKAPA
jgi:hypothetical protein